MKRSKFTFRFTTEGKAVPIQAWAWLQGAGKLRLLQFLDNQHMEMVRLSNLYTGHLYPPQDTPGPYCGRRD